MTNTNFRDMLEARWAEGKFVCVGLDSELSKIPKCARVYEYEGAPHDPEVPTNEDVAATLLKFNQAIVDATRDVVLAYKPNAAFYEAYGAQGLEALSETIAYIKEVAPEVPVILDAKRADIGNTNAGYVQAAFDELDADAITVHPYLGSEALKPFLDRADKGVIVLCRTSNPGAGEFQNLATEGVPQYQTVARRVAQNWNKNGNCAVVVGATYPQELQEVRQIVGDLPILIPGIGAQGGDLEKTVAAARDSRNRGMIINSSRAIIFASKGNDFAEAARRETIKLNDQITACLTNPVQPTSARRFHDEVNEAEITQIFAETDTLVVGSHFVYKAGDHGPEYFNKDAVFPHTKKLSRLCLAIAQRCISQDLSTIDVVVGPATGGISISNRTAEHLSNLLGHEVLSLYAEKTPEGSFAVKGGQEVHLANKKILVVEDVLNSGSSVKDVVELVRKHGGHVVGLGALCNRGGVTAEMVGSVPVLFSLANISLAKYPAANCPLCEQKKPFNLKLGKGRAYVDNARATGTFEEWMAR